MSVFDADQFLDVSIDEANTRRPPITAGLDYEAEIGEIKTASGEKDGKSWVSMVVPLKISVPPDQQERLGTSEITLTDRVFLDLTDSGTLDNGVGKNRGQRQYRDATGLNNPGQPFSWRMLQGRRVKVKVGHEMYNNEPQERVQGVAKI